MDNVLTTRVQIRVIHCNVFPNPWKKNQPSLFIILSVKKFHCNLNENEFTPLYLY